MAKSYRSIPIKHNKTVKNDKKYCMDVNFGSTNVFANVIGYPCHGGPNQKFRHNKKTKQLIAKHSKKCLENIVGRIYQNTCDPVRETQKWIRKKGKWMSLFNKKYIISDPNNCSIPLFV